MSNPTKMFNQGLSWKAADAARKLRQKSQMAMTAFQLAPKLSLPTSQWSTSSCCFHRHEKLVFKNQNMIAMMNNNWGSLINLLTCWLSSHILRVEICRDRHGRWSCKICSRCVNSPRKQCDFLHNLRRIQDWHTQSVILHWNCQNFTHSVKF